MTIVGHEPAAADDDNDVDETQSIIASSGLHIIW